MGESSLSANYSIREFSPVPVTKTVAPVTQNSSLQNQVLYVSPPLPADIGPYTLRIEVLETGVIEITRYGGSSVQWTT